MVVAVVGGGGCTLLYRPVSRTSKWGYYLFIFFFLGGGERGFWATLTPDPPKKERRTVIHWLRTCILYIHSLWKIVFSF